ncbi:MAG: hypothetical protein SNG34_03300, partial [Rikenellaceae bacterium]
LKEREQAELAKIRADKSKEKLKNSAADVGSKILDGASSLFGTSKVKRIEAENETLKADIETLKSNHTQEIESVKAESEEFKRAVDQRYNEIKRDFERRETDLKQEVSKLQSTIFKVLDLVPEMFAHLRFTELCRTIGFGIEWIRQLINGEEIRFNGNIYSKPHNKKFHTDGSVAKMHRPDRPEDATLLIDNKHHTEWFKEQHLKTSQRVDPPQQRRGRRM